MPLQKPLSNYLADLQEYRQLKDLRKGPIPRIGLRKMVMKFEKKTGDLDVLSRRRRRHLDAFTRGRIIGKLEEGRSVTSVAAEFGIAHSIVSRLWRKFQTTGTAIRRFSIGRP
ncbi:hypothetical protein TNCV_33051 [Trichonephila clavipes]|nr:hypothetical protein TNCV_33051 [Trichonephila clavipes]